MIIWLLLLFSTVFLLLHMTFVGSAGCLPSLLRTFNSSANFTIQNDYILQINIDKSYIDDTFSLTDDDAAEESVSSSSDVMAKYLSPYYRRMIQASSAFRTRRRGFQFNDIYYNEEPIMNGNDTTFLSSNFTSIPSISSSSSLNNSTNSNATSESFPSYDYEFATDASVLGLSPQLRQKHNFQLVNVSMVGDSCFGSSRIIENMIPFGGIDIVVQNAVKYTVRKGGVLATSRQDYFSWSTSDFETYPDFSSFLSTKINMGLLSFFAFFAISTLTALLVRVLISSGVVILFPIFWALQV